MKVNYLCARGAGTHGDVSNVQTKTCFISLNDF